MNDIEKLMKWFNKYNKKFQKQFGFEMPFDVYGIDMHKFAGAMGYSSPEEIHWAVIERMYGKKAVELINEIKTNSPLVGEHNDDSN